MRRKSLSHNAYVRKLNRQVQEHPDYRRGMRVTKVGGGLYELQPPEDVDPKNPRDMEEFRTNPDLQKVLWDSVAVVDKKYYYTGELTRSRMLPTNLLFRLSREGRRSRLLQRNLRLLHRAIVESKLQCGLWPADATPLIRSHHLTDPWRPGEPLQVKYTAPADRTGNLSREHVLAEYVREGKRKFALYADGHQETWRL